ncbi:LPS assembly protein LptD [Ascidiaceihabitans sp.]|nr:LPS assembly protein LptD [Ascidiaceihabitans sp.]
MFRQLIICAILCFTPALVLAQSNTLQPAILVADNVSIDQNRVLQAQGNVEVFQGDIRLKASSVSYDQKSGALQIIGPITIQDGANITILADQAELSSNLQNGLLIGARTVLNQRLQLSSVGMNRVDERYTLLYKTAVTSCNVCTEGRPPLWQIRAKRVVHDQTEQQLYFDDAQFRVGNIPVFYLPRLRLPDPTLKRATGFLIPSFRATSQLGTGVKVPYFIKLGKHRDITLSPYLSSKTQALEFRYRQAFETGNILFNGAATSDDLRANKTRGYIFGEGQFEFTGQYVLDFDIETTTDNAYLKEYRYSEKDRLDSEIAVSRTSRDKYVRVRFINFRSLRDNADNTKVPTNVFDVDFERRIIPKIIGGEISLDANAHAHFRSSKADVVGRDVLRFNLDVYWEKLLALKNGLFTETKLGFAADAFGTGQDSEFPLSETALIPYGSIALRYPLIRKTQKTTQIFEPLLQFGWVGQTHPKIPVEESTRVEFDEGNLLALSRYPRPDRRERGPTIAIGANWGRHDPNGWSTTLTVGQVLRSQNDSSFSETSGLSSTTSDFIVAGQFQTHSGLQLISRGLFNDLLDVAKAEMRGSWLTKKTSISASHLWLSDEDMQIKASELTFDGAYQINGYWSASSNWRYDLVEDRASNAGLGLIYQNECVSIGLSVNRSNRSSTSVEPSTNLGFKVSLQGFSASNGTQSFKRSCGKQMK